MKKTFFILIMVFAAVVVKSQNYPVIPDELQWQINQVIQDPTLDKAVVDSSVSVNSYQISSSQIVDSMLVYFWNPRDSAWKQKLLIIRNYDIYHKIVSEFSQILLGTMWSNGLSINYTYDSLNLLTEKNIQLWNFHDSAWKNVHRQLFIYDANGLEAEQTQQFWDNFNNSWKNQFRVQSVYTSNNLAQETVQFWSNYTNNWFNSKQVNYNYLNSLIADITISRYDWHISQWNADIKYSYTYDNNNKKTELLEQRWFRFDSTWNNSLKINYLYDANGNNNSWTSYLWNHFTNAWYNSMQNILTYDANNKIAESLYTKWNWHDSAWISLCKYGFGYENGNLVSVIRQIFDFHHQAWKNCEKLIWIHGGIPAENGGTTTIVAQKDANSVLCTMPNPISCGQYINITGLNSENTQLVITNMQGKIIYSENLPTDGLFNFNCNITSGFYILNVNSGNKNLLTKKIVVK